MHKIPSLRGSHSLGIGRLAGKFIEVRSSSDKEENRP